MTKKQLLRIGNNVASSWGAYCESVEKLQNGNYRFFCNEYGEHFYTDLEPAELAEYNY